MLHLSRYSCLGEALWDSMITYKTNTALIEADRYRENGRHDYSQLCAEAKRVAARLQSAGIQAGDRCGILMSNQSKWVVSGLGALWSGSTLVPLDYKLTTDEQLALIPLVKPKVLITEYGIWRSLTAEGHAGLQGIAVLVTEAPEDSQLAGAERWENPSEGEFTYVARTRQDTACIVYSSGTGGRPKGCMLSHDNYLEQAEVLGNMFPMQESDRFFSILPTNHALDFMCGFVIPLLFGGAVVHQRTLRPEFLSPTMKAYRITHIALVPRLLRNLEQRLREQIDALSPWKRLALGGLSTANELATARQPDHRISHMLLKPIHDRLGGRLRVIVAGGAFVDPSCVEFLYKLGLPVAVGYGLTEACTVLTVNDLKPFRADTVGRAVPGVEIELRDKNDAGIGEVYARGRSVMQGYLDDSELTAETITDGWLRTGDLGVMDAAGHLKLVGRAKNMIVTAGGKNVYPEDVEAAFDDLPHCEESCVFASNYIWQGGGLEDQHLLLVLRPERGSPSRELMTELSARNRGLADFKRVLSYVVWNHEFPRTATQKVKRGLLARQIAAEMSREQAASPL